MSCRSRGAGKMSRLLPPPRIKAAQTGNLLERCMNVHLVGGGEKPSVAWSIAGQVIGYASVIFLLLVAFSVFGNS